MKNRYYTVFLLLFLSVFIVEAQPPKYGKKWGRYNERKWEFLQKEVALSADEVLTIKPIFLDFEQKMWTLHQNGRKIFRKKEKTENNYRILNNQYINQEIRRAKLLKAYHQELEKILSPEKLFYYYLAERRFKGELLKKMHPRKRKQ